MWNYHNCRAKYNKDTANWGLVKGRIHALLFENIAAFQSFLDTLSQMFRLTTAKTYGLKLKLLVDDCVS